ncbi:peptide chain release factor N(5)-glutamine methyltransferase [Paenibacillus thiaminolyticus]|uniref:Release factor glutamine methyltransferase n=3 Tax=Paenibacillus thiaminolyticus TaxID=49283 RepID=A0AAP9DVR9_PANTH|nr:peptide chain release factor N(5)-glutamine methyltransferase [Paenibacillus thiaminolyticus]MCY9535149.1 peptide chain release factor N(5)-glutamine methyltransferase [Paenibacillus thiaminolyticus]MCY9602104.1 peptide chain release factor N(5)-glutamine methyltransferase [Paenibacillus thiaminolyticus]MCY9608837.1 peptide chain release factor N(5)-glutamine methyltransferase [Paenibacillus thiaminolyticus]MCY9615003.1 peptide chain release factor N(5)-glutamine methyltransferase [Paenibaci
MSRPGGSEQGARGSFRLAWPLTIREAWVQASSFLAAGGVEDAPHHAELLLRHVLGWERAAYLVRLPDPMPEAACRPYEAAMERRAGGEPTQYIIGEQHFYGLPFAVSPDVLIPRPETELLVEAIMAEADRLWPAGTALRAADIGTGSGAIACTLAHLRPSWQVTATDISPAALRMAQSNAGQLGVAARLSWREGDLLAPLAGSGLDVLVSNPPYIPAAEIGGLMREVRDYEPRTALDGGADGLDPYRRIVAMLPLLDSPPRLIGFEVGQGQARDVAALLEAAGYGERLVIVPDLAGIERHVIGVRASRPEDGEAAGRGGAEDGTEESGR